MNLPRRFINSLLRSTCFRLIVYGVFVYLICAPKHVYAYLDPGSGSYLFQILIAALLGSLFFMRRIIHKVKQIIDSLTRKDSKKENK